MITTPTRFRQCDLKRTLKAIEDVGLVVSRVEIDPATGKVTIYTAEAGTGAQPRAPLDDWLASNARAS